jgi:hypothetical protein
MKCFSEKIYSLFLDNELNSEEKKEVIFHLKKCEKCRITVEILRLENLKIKKSFKIDYNAPDLTGIIMEKIVSKKFSPLWKKTLWSYFIYGFFIIAGILAPYFTVNYIKSTFVFYSILSYIFTPIFFFFSSISFLIRKILLSGYDLNKVIIGQIFLITFLLINLIIYLVEKFKMKEEIK